MISEEQKQKILFDAMLKRITLKQAKTMLEENNLNIPLKRTPLHTILKNIISAAMPVGVYQNNIMSGQSRWSGSDLRGKARKYNARYWHSRNSLLNRMKAEAQKYGCKVELKRNPKTKIIEAFITTPDNKSFSVRS